MTKDILILISMGLFSLLLYFLDYPEVGIINNLFFWIWFFGSLKVVQILIKHQTYLLAIFIVLNIVTTWYFYYNYTHYDLINPIITFDFSAFNMKNLHKINNLMYFIFTIIYSILAISGKKIFKIQKNLGKDLKSIFNESLNKLKKINFTYIIIIIIIISFIDIIIFMSTFNIFNGAYGSTLQKNSFKIPNFLRALIGLISFFIYIIIKIKNNSNMTMQVLLMKLFYFGSLFFAILAYGSRGAVVGLIILLLIFDFLTDRKIIWKYINIISSFILIIILLIIWPFMRQDIYLSGLFSAFIHTLEYTLSAFSAFQDNHFKVVPMIPMTLFHFIYVSDLIDRGISLDYSTFLNLIPQQIPSALSDVIGYVRPLNDNWKLASYFRHGGGFYIFANAYWNGGVIPLGLFTAFVIQFLIWLETFFKKNDAIYYLAYALFLFLIPVNTFYGIQPFVRGMEYGLIGIFIIYLFKKVRIKR